jgi:hypothetical protein
MQGEHMTGEHKPGIHESFVLTRHIDLLETDDALTAAIVEVLANEDLVDTVFLKPGRKQAKAQIWAYSPD